MPVRGRRGACLASVSPKIKRRLSALPRAAVNFDASKLDQHTSEDGWRRDDLLQSLPSEAQGEPAEHGTWRIARRLIVDYQLADPSIVQAFYEHDAPLAGRNMLLRIRFAGMRFYVGVRIGEVYDSTRDVEGRNARVFGWYYRTLDGHFESGQMNYELWKWLDTGEVEFRIFAVSRPAERGPILLRTGFRLFGRTHQLCFYREICRRALRLTETQLETQAISASHT